MFLPSCSLTSHHPPCAQDLDVDRAPGASGHGGPAVQGQRQSQRQRVQCGLRKSRAGGEEEDACSGQLGQGGSGEGLCWTQKAWRQRLLCHL